MTRFLRLASLFVVANAAAQATLDLSAHSNAIPIYRRVETRGGYLGLTQTFPQNLNSIIRFLDGSESFAYDRFWLENCEPGFRKEKIHWSDSLRGNSFYLRPEMHSGGAFSEDSIGNYMLGGLGLTLYGQALRDLTFYSHGMVYTQKTGKAQFTHQYNPDLGETYSAEVTAEDSLAKSKTFNRFEYYVKYQKPWLTLKAGRDWVHMGPGYFSSLMATKNTPPYSLLEMRLDFAPWLFMDNYLIRMVDTRFTIQKYAQLHRFEFKPLSRLSVGFNDMVIYQDRDPDMRYVLPLAPLSFSEINNGGLDNSAMMLDFLWASPWNISLWGELFVDDLLGPTSFFDSWWENRWAGLAGIQWVSPWKRVDADVVVEYSHVEPWTYIGREAQTSFKHFNVPSASKLGPDSRSWDVQVGYRPWRRLEWKERLEWNAKDTGRAGRLGVVHSDLVDGTGKVFLKNARREFRVTHSVAWVWNRYARLEGWWRQSWGDAEWQEMGGVLVLGW